MKDLTDLKQVLYYYTREGLEFITPSFELATARSEDGNVYIL